MTMRAVAIGLGAAMLLPHPVRAAAARGRSVLADDFERDTKASPPTGWKMWGAARYKTPANYTRDTTDPHGGKACFRIHHPAGTSGYVVSSPAGAIRPREGMMYTVSFWARADGPGTSVFAEPVRSESWRNAGQSSGPAARCGEPSTLP